MNTDEIFAYPELEPRQKVEFERTVAPLELESGELAHLLSTPFPFDERTRRWLEYYVELSEIHHQKGPLAKLDRVMNRWVIRQRLYRKRVAHEKEATST